MIIKEIAHIHFTNLTVLSLGTNRLGTIEHFERVLMPSLRELYICKNGLIQGRTI